MSKKLEYTIETFEVKDFTDKKKKQLTNQKINQMGKNGWRLSQMDSVIADKLLSYSCTLHFILIFEREIS